MFCVFLSARDIQVVRLMTLIADVVYMNQASSRVFEEELLLLKSPFAHFGVGCC